MELLSGPMSRTFALIRYIWIQLVRRICVSWNSQGGQRFSAHHEFKPMVDIDYRPRLVYFCNRFLMSSFEGIANLV